jgi:hypothetical protein
VINVLLYRVKSSEMELRVLRLSLESELNVAQGVGIYVYEVSGIVRYILRS